MKYTTITVDQETASYLDALSDYTGIKSRSQFVAFLAKQYEHTIRRNPTFDAQALEDAKLKKSAVAQISTPFLSSGFSGFSLFDVFSSGFFVDSSVSLGVTGL